MAVGHLTPKFGIQRVALGLAAVAVAALVLGVAKSAALGPAGSYTSIAFADGFESGDLSHWNGLLGNGSATATAAAARTGSYGLRLSNASGQFQVLAKGLDQPLADSSMTFWVRIASGAGFQTVAEARDGSSSAHMWDLYYDGGQQAFHLYPYSSTGSTEISTGNGSAPSGTWLKVEIQYTATATGGARIYINDQTQASWTVTGDYTRTANFQRIQLWNDGANVTDFDDVSVGTPPGAPSPPGAPTGVTGTAGNASANLSWTAPASNGGSAITSYRITPYIGGTAQTPVVTPTAATSFNVTGLTNGTTYTFTVAATNSAGTGADSAPSPPLTPRAAATAPGAPTNVFGSPGDHSVALGWTAPASDGGSAITSYRIVPFIGTTAQPAINTPTSATNYTVTGLTNGTAYTFTVAATNSVGTGAPSAASAALTPGAGYSNVVFADGFESGGLTNWNGAPGNGTSTVLAAAAHAGTYGLRTTNTAGQFSYIPKSLASPLADSSVSFWVRLSSGSGLETLAEARDGSSSAHMWDLYYNWNTQSLILDAFRAAGADEVTSGPGTVLPGGWVKVSVQYTATATGGARLYVNDVTQPAWMTVGNYTRAANLQILQLWNDAVGSTDFDDVRIATPPPPGATVPGTPTGVGGLARDHAVALTWNAPASDGGSPISGYRITPRIANGDTLDPVFTPYADTSYTVTGLANGTAYTFTVAALNGVGNGPDSSSSAAVTPTAATVPGAPTGITASPQDASVNLSWTAPADGGSSITGYFVTPFINGSPQSPIPTGSTATGYTVTGLTNGTAYTFTVRAANGVGQGPASAQTAAVTPRAALSQYTDTIFSDGFESGNLSNWNSTQGTGTSSVVAAAAHTGGFGLRVATLETQYAYDVKVLNGALADSLTTFWIRLGAGSRVVTVAQTRDSSYSTAMWMLMYDGTRHGFLFYPYGSGGTSTEIFTGVNSVPAAQWAQVQVQYTGTAQGTARLYVNGQTQPGWGLNGNFSHTANLQIIQLWNEGLANNDFDDFAVATVPPPGAQPPGAPTDVTGTALDRAVQLDWTAPASNGGSIITGYKISEYVNGQRLSSLLTGSAATTFRVGGLTNGTAYTFTVAALNAAGSGPESTQSNEVTPVPSPPPGPPLGVTATAGDRSVPLTWTAPSSDGGSPITGYRVTPYINGSPQTPIATGSTATSFTVTGLTNGTTYTFTVAATNSTGYGAESQQSNAVTPAPPTVAGRPTGVAGAPRDSAVALTWTAPTSDGGTAITSYRIVPYIGNNAQTPVTTPSAATGFTVTGLTNGTTYTFTVAANNAVGTGPASDPSAPVTPAVPPANPIVLENRNPGTTSWQLGIDHKAERHEIEGYASATSVAKGASINLMVSLSSNAQYTMDIYRMGWYPQGTNPDGTSCAPSCGGRLMLHVGPLSGTHQAVCPTVTTQNDFNFGLTECNWTPSYTLNVPASWTTGNYIVKLRRLDGQQLESYMTFVVRDDSSTAPVVYSMDTTTWEAYNFWGGDRNNNVGYDLYGRFDDLSGNPTGGRAYTVSFDRPYLGEAATDGAGSFFDWDFPMVRWMESKGYDISYVTSVDLEQNPNLLLTHKVFMNTGHDEYYSDNMRAALTNAIAGGVDMAFFSANNFYYRITWAPSATGTANRRIHSDKNALVGSTTFEWRLLSPQHPENEIGGVMLEGVANDRPFLVSDASSWIYAGTGLHNYTGNGTTGVITSGANQNALPGIIGYEFDSRATTTANLSTWASYEPSTTHTVGHSFVPAGDGNSSNVWSDSVLWTAPSGAMIFSAGTIEWSWGLDDGYNSGYCSCFHQYTNAATQRVTQNVLDRFSGP